MVHYKNICGLIDKNLTKLCQLSRQLGYPDSDTFLTKFCQLGSHIGHYYTSAWSSRAGVATVELHGIVNVNSAFTCTHRLKLNCYVNHVCCFLEVSCCDSVTRIMTLGPVATLGISVKIFQNFRSLLTWFTLHQ